MLSHGELKTPQDFLAAAEKEFALGDLVAGEALLADAATCAVRALVKGMGWPHESSDELVDALRQLDGESDKPGFRSGFQMIRATSEMVKTGYAYGSEFEDSWRDFLYARDYIERLRALDSGQ